MKKDTHPPYQDVLFIDSATGHKFIIGSTYKTDKKETHEGKEYPVCVVSVSSASHPFFTGSKQFIDSEGRVDKFLKRYANAGKKQQDQGSKDQDQDPKKAKSPTKKKK
ncbi:MAG: type B 50S ribosomal protein L31 [Parachlamydiales bacterium]|nr:type B 50S ribosomal protein L31 [Parachlamydiales bacterium]